MKILPFISLLFLSAIAYTQEDFKGIAEETCACIQKKDLSTATKKSIEVALGLCMFEVIQARNIEVDLNDGDAMRKFGEKVGMQMAPICPDIFSKLMDDAAQPKTAIATETVGGVIKSIEEKEFLFITLKDEAGREVRLVWLRHVEGADSYLSDYKKLIGKKVILSYQNFELFNAKAKGYFSYKMLTALKLE
ncbi:MAG: hypothetical protein KF856_07405 [Cyclobacteriaceae bacterium]|nr:hypothetical protein [Cyclobacteriaceae bacterium]